MFFFGFFFVASGFEGIDMKRMKRNETKRINPRLLSEDSFQLLLGAAIIDQPTTSTT
jgi:hypothetical protein